MLARISKPRDFQRRFIEVMKHKTPTKHGFAFVYENELPLTHPDDEIIVLKFRPDHCDGEYYLHFVPPYEPIVEKVTQMHVNHLKTTRGLRGHATALYEERETYSFQYAVWYELLAYGCITDKEYKWIFGHDIYDEMESHSML